MKRFRFLTCTLVYCMLFMLPANAAELGGAGVGGGWTLGTDGVIVDTILDEDAMGSDDANALATQQSIKAYVDASGGGGGSSRWTDEGTFTRTDDNTINITTADCTNFQTGTPIRFSADESTWFYAMVDTCSDAGATINIDIFGHPIETDKDDYLNYGIPEALSHKQLNGVGNCDVSDVWFSPYFWTGQDAYLIMIYLYVNTQATGSALELNVELNGTNALDTEFSLAASTSQADSGTTIDNTTYANALIEQEEFIEISVSQCGSTIPGGNTAFLKLIFVTP